MREFTCAVIDDDADWADLVRRALARPGLFPVIKSFTDPESALEALRETAVDIVICDLRMPKMSGLDFAGELRRFDVGTPVVIMSSDLVSENEIHSVGATRYLSKRNLNTEVAATIRLLLANNPDVGSKTPKRNNDFLPQYTHIEE